MFPGEDEFIGRVESEVADCLQLVSSMIITGSDIISQRFPTVKPDESPWAYRVGHGLCVRACKMLRSCLELARIGSDTELHILTRSLFETFVAANFSLSPNLSFNSPGKPGVNLSCDQRAQVYAAFQVVDHLRRLEVLQSHTGCPPELRVVNKSKMEKDVAGFEARIGVEWITQFKKRPRTYSGLNIKELCDRIGKPCDEFYLKLYGLHSRSTHAVDIESHIKFSAEEQRMVAKWFCKPEEIKRLLLLATALTWGCFDLLDKQFRFDGETRLALTIGLDWIRRVSAS